MSAELVDARYGRKGVRPPDEVGRLADQIAALFSEDAVWDGGALGVSAGRDAIRARMAEPTLSFSRHYFVSPRIELERDRARASWELLAPCTSQDGRAMWMAGTEDDEYVRVGGVSKDLPEDFHTDLSRTLDQIEKVMVEVEGLLNNNKIFRDRMAGIGAMTRDDPICKRSRIRTMWQQLRIYRGDRVDKSAQRQPS